MENNKLTRFDVKHQTHEESALGGIPQGFAPDGKQNVVESGETKKNNFIYSNRILLNKDLVKQFNLPGYVSNRSISDASKSIDSKFQDRADKYAQETKKTLLDRLAGAQEYLKQQEQASLEQANQSMQANSQQIPDQMNGQIPEGMEGYAQQEPQQSQDIQNIQTTSPIAAFGGYQQHRYSGIDNPNSEMNVARPQLSSVSELKPAGLVPLQGATLSAHGVPDSAGKIPTSATTSAGPGAGAIVGAAGTAMDLGQLAFGKSAQDTSGLAASGRVGGASMIGGAALKGAAAGAAFGPWGAAIGGVFGGIAGVAGLKKARAAEMKNTTNFALNTNSQFQDQHAYGGNMNKYYGGGNLNDIFKVTQNLNPQVTQDLIKKNDIATNSSILQKYNNEAINPGLYSTQKQLDGDKYSFKNRLGRAGEFINENAGDAMKLAPIAMNAYQLASMKKPTGFQYQTLNNRYKPRYIDEAQMQRIVDQEGNNTISAISKLGGSEGATRNAILAAGLNKTKGLGDAYANAYAQNIAQDAQAQQFNLGVDSQNISINNKAIDEMRADKGAYNSAKSKYLSAIGTDIGEIGKEKNASDAAITMFGYTRKGKFVVDKNGNKVSTETLARRQADFAAYVSEQNKKDNK